MTNDARPTTAPADEAAFNAWHDAASAAFVAHGLSIRDTDASDAEEAFAAGTTPGAYAAAYAADEA